MADFPVDSLKHFLIPNQVLSFKLFQAKSAVELTEQINAWIAQTKNIIVSSGAPGVIGEDIAIGLTFVPAVET